MVSGRPVWAVKMGENSQPPSNKSTPRDQFVPIERSRPNGNCQTPDSTKRCVTSNSDGPYSSRRCLGSCGSLNSPTSTPLPTPLVERWSTESVSALPYVYEVRSVRPFENRRSSFACSEL